MSSYIKSWTKGYRIVITLKIDSAHSNTCHHLSFKHGRLAVLTHAESSGGTLYEMLGLEELNGRNPLRLPLLSLLTHPVGTCIVYCHSQHVPLPLQTLKPSNLATLGHSISSY